MVCVILMVRKKRCWVEFETDLILIEKRIHSHSPWSPVTVLHTNWWWVTMLARECDALDRAQAGVLSRETITSDSDGCCWVKPDNFFHYLKKSILIYPSMDNLADLEVALLVTSKSPLWMLASCWGLKFVRISLPPREDSLPFHGHGSNTLVLLYFFKLKS